MVDRYPFLEVPICREHRVCWLCRTDATFRSHLLATTSDVTTVDFACPDDLPLLPADATEPQRADLRDAIVLLRNPGMRLLTADEQASRAALCQACDRNVNGRCSLCGCGGLPGVISRLAATKCPLDRWQVTP